MIPSEDQQIRNAQVRFAITGISVPNRSSRTTQSANCPCSSSFLTSISTRPASMMPATLFFKAFRKPTVKTLSRSWLSRPLGRVDSMFCVTNASPPGSRPAQCVQALRWPFGGLEAHCKFRTGIAGGLTYQTVGIGFPPVRLLVEARPVNQIALSWRYKWSAGSCRRLQAGRLGSCEARGDLRNPLAGGQRSPPKHSLPAP